MTDNSPTAAPTDPGPQSPTDPGPQSPTDPGPQSPAGTGARLDPLFADPVRLGIVSVLAGAKWAEFGFVRDAVELSDSALSKRISGLSDAGYVEVRKGYVGKRPRTWLNLSAAGRSALSAHIAKLQEIAKLL